MRTTQYVRQARAIFAADASGIRERWFLGLRLLRDPEVMTDSGKSFRHGVLERLVEATKLSDREIRRFVQCARTYQRESQIGRAAADFATWRDLSDALFPDYDAPDSEPLADHRTPGERRRDLARDLADRAGLQDALFPLDQYEPSEATLKDLREYAEQQREITERFAAHDEKRFAYLERLVEVASGDESMTWAAAAALLPGDDGLA